MKGMLLLSGYESFQQRKEARVYRRLEKNDYIAVCYLEGLESEAHPFPNESEADDFAEEWVLKNNK